VPGCEKNKGSILQRAVQYIGQLKDAETTNLEKWTLEKLLLDQAINELSQTCDRLKTDYQRAWEEKEAYKKACEENGLTVEIEQHPESDAPAPES
jgi:transcriptional regulator CBF1